jgi:hypothetical protein
LSPALNIFGVFAGTAKTQITTRLSAELLIPGMVPYVVTLVQIFVGDMFAHHSFMSCTEADLHVKPSECALEKQSACPICPQITHSGVTE